MTGLDIKALLAHPRWADIRDLTGLSSNPRLARSHIVRDLRTDIPITRDGLLIVLYSADRHDWRVDALLSHCPEKGVSALLVEGHDSLLSSTVALAQRLNIHVLGATDPLSAHSDLLRLIAEPDLERANMVLNVLSRVREAESDVEEALRAIARSMGRPVALLDGHGTIMAGDLGEVHEAIDLSGQEPGARQPIRRFNPDGSLLIAYPLQSVGAVTWLAAHLPAQLPVEEQAVESALLAVGSTVEHRLVLARMSLERDANRRASLLAETLQRPDAHNTRRRALELGWELDGWHTGIHIGTTTDLDLTGRRAEVVNAFEDAGLPIVVVEHGDGWTLWTTTRHEPTALEVQSTATTIRRVHRRLQSTFDVHVGVGRPHPGAEGIGRSVAEATDAASLARGRPETGHFLHVDRLGLAQLLLAWTRTDTFQPAARSLLDPLAKAPGDLVTTLAAYLDAESSLTETAAVLGVHRNTVSARIARIETMLGVDLSVPDDRLALHLACRTALQRPEG